MDKRKRPSAGPPITSFFVKRSRDGRSFLNTHSYLHLSMHTTLEVRDEATSTATGGIQSGHGKINNKQLKQEQIIYI